MDDGLQVGAGDEVGLVRLAARLVDLCVVGGLWGLGVLGGGFLAWWGRWWEAGAGAEEGGRGTAIGPTPPLQPPYPHPQTPNPKPPTTRGEQTFMMSR